MKSEGKVKRKFKQAKFRHLKKRLQANFKQTPDNCRHNRVVDLGSLASPRDLGLCGCQSAVICDRLDHKSYEGAKACDLFEPHLSKEEVSLEFDMALKGDIGDIAQEYPDLAALLWVLDLENLENRPIPAEVLEDEPSPEGASDENISDEAPEDEAYEKHLVPVPVFEPEDTFWAFLVSLWGRLRGWVGDQR